MTIPRWVADYLTIPFQSGGRDRCGCDCFGLVRLVLADRLGVVCPAYGFVGAHDRVAIAATFREGSAAPVWQALPIAVAQAFDVVPLGGTVRLQSGAVTFAEIHVGIMVSSSHLLHTSEDDGPSCVPLERFRRRLIPKDNPLVRRHVALCND